MGYDKFEAKKITMKKDNGYLMVFTIYLYVDNYPRVSKDDQLFNACLYGPAESKPDVFYSRFSDDAEAQAKKEIRNGWGHMEEVDWEWIRW